MPKPSPSPLPRVEIFYEVDIGAEKNRKQLPFVVGVLAELAGHELEAPRRFRNRKFVAIDVDNFDSFMGKVAPRIAFAVDSRLEPDAGKLGVELRFRQMDDFAPLSVAVQIPALRALLDLRTRLNDLQAAVHANNRLDDLIKQALLNRVGEDDPGGRDALVGQLITQGHFGRFAEDTANAAESLRELFRELDEGRMVLSPTTDAMLSERIARIDNLLSAQLNEVFHRSDFQRLEASWRGLEYLVRRTATSPMLKIKVLSVSKKEILKDLQRAVELDQSGIFRLVYEEEYGTLGGEPFGVLIGDYGFDRGADDLELLAQLSNVAEAAKAPFIAAAQPELFNLDSFRELSMPRDLAKIFDNSVYVRWHAFRKSPDSRYVGLVLPRVLQRLPYGRGVLAADGFDYEEGVDGTDPTKYLWGHAVYAFAVRLTEAFQRFGWCSAISGIEHGGVVLGLPVQRFLSDDVETVVTCPTEIAISDRRREELRNLGFIPLCHEKGTDRAVFFDAQSCQKPLLYLDDSLRRSAVEGAKLEYVFAVSRFSQYIGLIVRDKAWQFRTRSEWERYLNEWLADYVLLDDDAEPEVKARYPLCEGNIELGEMPGRPGQFRGILKLRPNYQLNRPDTLIEETVDRIGARTKATRYGQ